MEPLSGGLVMLSPSGSDERNVGVTGVCGYPSPTETAGQASTKSANGEPPTAVICDGHMGVSKAIVPRPRGLSQRLGGPGIKHTYTTQRESEVSLDTSDKKDK
jgi:hypothetical protein